MTFEDTRDAITDTLRGVSGTGIVFSHIRFSADLESFLTLYTIPHPIDATKKVPAVTFITRAGPISETAMRDEMQVGVLVNRDETWRIVFMYGFYDDEDSAGASDTYFQKVVDDIMAAFRWGGGITGTYVVAVHPLICTTCGLFSQELSGYTCHKAEFQLRIESQIQ